MRAASFGTTWLTAACSIIPNTLTRRIEELEPFEPGTVRLYTCGPTVYDFAHIGNFRSYVWEDLLRRTLKLEGFAVEQVMNITDIEDKIIARMAAEKLSLEEVTEPITEAFFEDLDALYISGRNTIHAPASIFRKCSSLPASFRKEG